MMNQSVVGKCGAVALAVLAVCGGRALAKIDVIAAPDVGGPAGALAGRQIATWPVVSPVEVLSQSPAALPAEVTLVIELKEDFDFAGEMPMAQGATIHVVANSAGLPHAVALANLAAAAINKSIDTPSEQFVVTSAVAPDATAAKITVITSTKNEIEQQRISIRTRQFRVAVHTILLAEHAISDSVTPQHIMGPRQPGVVRVAFYDDLGARNRTAGCNPSYVRQTLRSLKDLDVELVSAEDIRSGALAGQFDVLIMGGGSSRTEGKTLGDEGKKQIIDFVDQGGGYVGVCAGAFLASHNSIGLGIAPAQTKPSGAGGLASLTISDEARANANLSTSTAHVAFHGGPILSLVPDAAQFDAKIWATFSADVVADSAASEGDEDSTAKPKGKKVIPLGGAPAVLSGRYGKGRVVIFAPHPERAPGPQPLFWAGIRFAGGESIDELRSAARQSVGVVDPIDSASAVKPADTQ